ncbi:MAG: A/G-specific adenine glycosylase [Gammaproteobacteria bacterium]
MTEFSQAILHWFDKHGRHDLPWQKNPTPYRVWVSEIMLQQTQVITVIPYYERFLHSFPSIDALAKADIDQVLHHWSGLGYYARGRNLHKAAQLVVNEHQGQFPTSFDQIIALPGIGRSTAGAILSLSMHQRFAILDGNVKRVLTRFNAIEGWPGKKEIEQKLWKIAEKNTPKKNVDSYAQAIMDLGATVCTRSKPKCQNCPVEKDCLARKLDRQKDFPTSKPKKSLPTKEKVFLILKNDQGEILLEKRPPTGIWGGLWSLPEFDHDSDPKNIFEKRFGLKINNPEKQQPVRHTFSHFHLEITPVIAEIKNNPTMIMEPGQTLWYKADQIKNIGLAAPVAKLLQKIEKDKTK